MNRYYPSKETTAVVEPELLLDVEIHRRLVKAERSLARLELAGRITPYEEWLVQTFIRVEAVATSRIAHSRATLLDLMTYAATGRSGDADRFDIVDLDTHLLSRQRMIEALLEEFDAYIRSESKLPYLVRAGLAHARIERIKSHPVDDGRAERQLVLLLLERWGLLTRPLLYLSRYLEKHRTEYHRLLGAARKDGEWKAWCLFFLDGVAETADDAVGLIRDLLALVAADRHGLVAEPAATMMTLRLFEQLPLHPVVTTALAVRLLKASKPTAIKAISLLERLGVLSEVSRRRRDRTFAYAGWMDRLQAVFE